MLYKPSPATFRMTTVYVYYLCRLNLFPIMMITFEQALEIIQSQPPNGMVEHIDFQAAAGRVLSYPVSSDTDMPPFNKSAMDGYACRKADLPGPLRVDGEVPAGEMHAHPLSEKSCVRIMTGAPLPQGADCVIMDEHTTVDSEGMVFFTKEFSKTNVCYQGEDVKVGQELIEASTLLGSEHIAILASAGAVEVEVSRQPVIAVYSTGNELVEPGEKLHRSMIRNSNGYQIAAQLRQCGLPAQYRSIIPDTYEATVETINEAFLKHDIVVLTGGVSHGTYDYVPQAMAACGIEILFHHLAVQPGKPSLFGKRNDGKYFFGLPGNPVSCFLQTELLVKLLCYQLQGHRYHPPAVRLPMGVAYVRKRTQRKAFVPVRITNGELFPVNYHGSANIQALHGAHGFMVIEQGVPQIDKGAMADVRLI